jgi:hypothetical protein
MHRMLSHTAIVGLSMALLLTTRAMAHEGEHGQGEVMLIAAVAPGSAAEAAGLVAGDRILDWDGEKLTTQRELEVFLGSHHPGETILLTLERESGTVQRPLTFGTRPDGGPSIGISLGVAASNPAESEVEGFSRAECLDWVDEVYQMASVTQELGIDLSAEIDGIRECMEDNTQRMAVPIPQTWCDNVFKIHCSGLDLLAEIGDALVARCEEELKTTPGVDLHGSPAWNTCGEQKVFDRYSRQGQISDLQACRDILLEECGADRVD